ncbi:MAG: TonB-dependent receptor domain-containing protein [Gemmatimonadales bacterium]
MSDRFVSRAAGALLFLLCLAGMAQAAPPTGDLHGVVTDSTSSVPIGSAQVSVMRDGRVVVNVLTDAFGRYRAHNLAAGSYEVSVHFIGFRPFSKTVSIAGEDVSLDVHLSSAAVELSAVKVLAEATVAVDTRSGDQTYSQDRAHSAPTTTSSQVIQQSVAGAVRAPTGEVHIRGQHAEYTYYVDGVPVPSGVSGSLNELFDPAIVNTINFRTGGWDAEFGNKNAAVVDVTTRIPTGPFHMNATGFGGAFGTSGQSVNMSGNSGTTGWFASFSRQVTDMRKEPVIFDTTSFKPFNFHNHGEDTYAFAKLQLNPSKSDVVNIEGNWSSTKFQVPFDSSGGTQADDHQQDMNAFLNFGWRHLFGAVSGGAADETRNELFTGLFVRTGSLKFTPGVNDDPQFVFFPDTNPYNLREDRSFTTSGIKLDYTAHNSEKFEFKTGVLAQITSGHENFGTVSATGGLGPASNSGLNGSDVGVYAQTAWSPSEYLELRTGVRYDAHNAPFAGTRTQVSPRVRLNIHVSPQTTLYGFYGRLFIPTNVEDLRAVTSAAQGNVVADPTLPERDDFFEAGLIHRWDVGGIVTKLSAYHKVSTPGIDDNTVPGSAIVTSVNIANVRITGVEAVVEFHPTGAFSGNINAALNHAYGYGTITGGFFPADNPTGFFDLDHDQRLTINGNVNYSVGGLFLSATGIYGSGLTNGVAPADCGCTFGREITDFNSGTHVKPSFIANVSAGYSFLFGSTNVRPELFIDNVLDKRYLLKGAFFSGASVGRPRAVQFKVNVGL